MKKKPLIVIILGILHLIEPLTKIIYLKLVTGFPFSIVLNNIFAIDGVKAIFEFWFLFPIGGLALLAIKKWSYTTFVAVQFYSIMTHLNYEEYSWPYVSSSPMITSIILLAVNVVLILYFILPSVRKPFLDKRIRWWESKKRYGATIPCSIKSEACPDEEQGEILNISESGVFIRGLSKINLNEEITMKFSLYNLKFNIKGIVKSRHEFEGQLGWGIEFEYEKWKEKFDIIRLIKILKLAYKGSLAR